MMFKRMFSAVAAAGAVLALAACSSAGAPAEPEPSHEPVPVEATVERGIPEGWQVADPNAAPTDSTLAGWIEDGKTFGVVTWGSSSCPPVAETLQLVSPGELRLVFGAPTQQICTADMSPTTHEIALPEGATKRPISLEVVYSEYDETVTLTLE